MTSDNFPLELTGENIPMVRFEKVTKRYGELTVLDALDLDVASNEMIAIIGPSGSGKTTVLRMLMTLELIDEGVIYVDGKPLTHMEKNGKLVWASQSHIRKMRTQLGMVFQQFNLFPHMTAIQNCMEAPVQVLGLSK
ncbi:MAG: ATP-binding cassette domain-containing protein, partial [Desulfobacterales bacterium]